jgi:type II secretory pathway component PulF
VGGLLAVGGAFPEEMVRSFCVGEQTGELDSELQRLAADYQADGLARLDSLAEWLPRLLYIGVVIYVAYGAVTFYRSYLDQMMRLMDGN